MVADNVCAILLEFTHSQCLRNILLVLAELKLAVRCSCGLTGSVVPGAGAFEIAAHAELMKCKDTIKGRSRLGYLPLCTAMCFVHILQYYCP